MNIGESDDVPVPLKKTAILFFELRTDLKMKGEWSCHILIAYINMGLV
jgi:hypothetical protein